MSQEGDAELPVAPSMAPATESAEAVDGGAAAASPTPTPTSAPATEPVSVVTASDADAVAPAAAVPVATTSSEPAVSVTAAATGEVDNSSLGFLSGGSVRGRWRDLGGGNSKPAVGATSGSATKAAARPSTDAAAGGVSESATEGGAGGDAAPSAEKPSGAPRTPADVTVTIKGETFTLAQLVAAKKGKSEGVLANIDFDLKHSYLSDTDFEFLFGMHIDQFLELPQWKQTAARKKLGLF